MRPLLRAVLRAALLLSVFALALPPAPAHAQGAPEAEEEGPGIRFNGLGRTLIRQVDLGGDLLDTDTTSVESLTDGEFLLDLAVNGQPNDVTEVQAVIRFRNEFGGFFGAGVNVEVRELWARGIVADVLRYRVGDMDVALTPYTLFLSEADGSVNEPEVFVPQKELIYYEEFYTGFNTRRLQGGRLDFGLEFEQGLDALDARVFAARLRTTDFETTPSRFIAGGRVGATSSPFGPYQSRAGLGVNLAHTWDDLDSGNANTGIRNTVVSGDGDLTVIDRDAYALSLVGEGGWSVVKLQNVIEEVTEGPADEDPNGEMPGGEMPGGEMPGGEMPEDEPPTEVVDVTTRTETLIEEDDTFIEIGLAGELKNLGLGLSALFVDVGPEFYSSAAQSKRIDYTRPRSFYNRIGNDRALRPVTLFDLTRDPAVYTFRIADELLQYDPRYNNALPYGRATPNRRGVRLEAAYAQDDVPVEAGLMTAVLREIRGEGTDELKDFLLLRAEADVDIARVIDWDRNLGFTLGVQYENTSRGGEGVEVVDLTSTLVEAGVSVEVYDRLDVLLGTKVRVSDGRDYVPVIENFNDIRDFREPFITDDQEVLLGTGLRYRFTEGIYLTVQYQHFSYSDDATPDDDYTLGQVFALYSMSF
jgi:hypothetical protein